MSNIARMMQQATAGAAGAGLDVDEVFSTFLYTGNGTAGRTITNNIDISTEGGLIWTKSRDSTYNHTLGDTANGVNKYLYSNTTADIDTSSAYYSAFNTNGYVIGDTSTGGNANELNSNSVDYVSWTFRKAPKFFDVVTYSGSSSAQTIAHNLGVTPAMIIVKQLNSSGRWTVYHKDASPTDNPENGRVSLNTTDQWYEYPSISSFANLWNQTAPTSTHFTVGTDATTGANGSTYVAYLFAHNNNDGEFGPSSDQDIIKCDKYTGGTTGTEVNVGFEPQFVMIKRTTGSGDWMVFDAMRGVVSDPYENLDNTLFWNHTRVERTNTGYIGFTPTGFIHQGGSGDTNTNGDNYIYMAIRRGSLAAPTDATKVLAIDKYEDGSGDGPTNGIVNDFSLLKAVSGSGSWFATARLRQGHRLKTDSSAAAAANSNAVYDRMDGVWNTAMNNYILWGWKRAIGYFDVATYNGNAQASAITVNHNLGVVPEMMWCKKLGASGDWMVYHKALNGGTNPHTYRLRLNSTGAEGTGSGVWNAAPTATQFSVGTDSDVNADADKGFITFLFATVSGVIKVGSFTGSDSDQTIDCGFSSGARFVLIKCRTDSQNWAVWDATRGIVSGNEPYSVLDRSDADITGQDRLDPHSSGFTVAGDFTTGNDAGQSYIFYAIA